MTCSLSPPSNLRRYGAPPYRVAVLHGGPGAAGEMAPVARELAASQGVLEPLQTADSVSGQIGELAACLAAHGQPPMAVVGYSWGAWLAILLAARHPELVARLVLVSSGPLTEAHAASIMETRLGRLSPQERRETTALLAAGERMGEAGLARLGALCNRADTYAPAPDTPDAPVDFQATIFARVWPEAAALRRSGELLRLASTIGCPVRAIHGLYDPHPAAGVRDPLAACLADFACTGLPRCGHTPWRERQAREVFFQALCAALQE